MIALSMTMLFAGQKFRFKGRNGIARAREMAAELEGACIRTGPEIELTCDAEFRIKPVRFGGNGAGKIFQSGQAGWLPAESGETPNFQ